MMAETGAKPGSGGKERIFMEVGDKPDLGLNSG
jgi:hypothetical protein